MSCSDGGKTDVGEKSFSGEKEAVVRRATRESQARGAALPNSKSRCEMAGQFLKTALGRGRG